MKKSESSRKPNGIWFPNRFAALYIEAFGGLQRCVDTVRGESEVVHSPCWISAAGYAPMTCHVICVKSKGFA